MAFTFPFVARGTTCKKKMVKLLEMEEDGQATRDELLETNWVAFTFHFFAGEIGLPKEGGQATVDGLREPNLGMD